jgi:hypothetical protein
MKMMLRMTALAFAALAVVGCASPGEIREGANDHLAKARVYEAHGDYYHATRERSAADRQFAKANERAYREAQAGIYRY